MTSQKKRTKVEVTDNLVGMDWVLSQLSGMEFPGRGEAHQFLLRAWEAAGGKGADLGFDGYGVPVSESSLLAIIDRDLHPELQPNPHVPSDSDKETNRKHALRAIGLYGDRRADIAQQITREVYQKLLDDARRGANNQMHDREEFVRQLAEKTAECERLQSELAAMTETAESHCRKLEEIHALSGG